MQTEVLVAFSFIKPNCLTQYVSFATCLIFVLASWEKILTLENTVSILFARSSIHLNDSNSSLDVNSSDLCPLHTHREEVDP